MKKIIFLLTFFISFILTAQQTTQSIDLTQGWNITSFCVEPNSLNMLDIVDPLISNSTLVKVIDEAGNFIQHIPPYGWMNTIGNMSNSEGYQFNVNSNTTLDITGEMVLLPCSVDLIQGWNIMGYPLDTNQDALAVLDPLMDSDSIQNLIIDHIYNDLNDIPQQWIDSAKANLWIGYGHTSHGSQLVSGMAAINNYFGGNLYGYSTTQYPHLLHLDDGGSGILSGDLGYVDWHTKSRTYLDTYPGCNVIMWSWCGQVDDLALMYGTSLQSHLFDPLDQLAVDYPDVHFVIMTGHLEGEGIGGNLQVSNDSIRDYCSNSLNNIVLFDFADIEKYSPDADTNFQVYYATDECNYDAPNGTTRNWANHWLNDNPSHELTQISQLCGSCSHSISLNCVKKGVAVWHLWAILAGWETDASGGGSGTLIKVIDEAGNFVQNIPPYGWLNTIGNFEPDEGYLIKMMSDDNLIFSNNTKSFFKINNVKQKSDCFHELLGNPYLPMSVLVENIITNNFNFEVGDEIGVYDGDILVGSTVIDTSTNVQIIVTRADDPITPEIDGFIEGNSILFRYCDKSQDTIYKDVVSEYKWGDELFTNLGTHLCDVTVTGLTTNIIDKDVHISLVQNYPNPFYNNTVIEYNLCEESYVVLSVFDILGNCIEILEDNLKGIGKHYVNFDASNIKAGTYFSKLEITGKNSKIEINRMVKLK